MSALVSILLSVGIMGKEVQAVSYSGLESVNLPSRTVEQIAAGPPSVADFGVEDDNLQRAHWSNVTIFSSPFNKHRINFPAATVDKYWKAVADMDGDGRRDLIFKRDGKLKLGRNIGSNSRPEYLAPIDLFGEGDFSMGEVGDGSLPLKLTLSTEIIGSKGVGKSTVEYVRLQDLNGDGRLDIVDARSPGEWIAYMNMPSGHGTGGYPIYWEKLTLAVEQRVDEWRSRVSVGGHGGDFKNGWVSGARFPLSWTLSGTYRLAEAWGYAFWGWNVQNSCTAVTSLDPVQMSRTACAWERFPSSDLEWQLGSSTVFDLVFDLTDANGDGYVDLVSSRWPQGFQVIGLTPADLENTVENPECRQGICEPGLFRAEAGRPWEQDYLGLVVLPKPESVLEDLPAELQVVRNNYDKFATCFDDGEVYCNPVPPFTIDAYENCYSWYGGFRRDLSPTHPSSCLVEDISTRWQGNIRAQQQLPRGSLTIISNVAGFGN
ncbi:FG-GAP repeat domain-containing protein [Microbulbifer taiwanensis]|uniref:FG-GAP repeat domain-containing protein n=1 Tax=Microbulbifer taiwanensis TaxID=986746 RepID=A0ABW1YRW3_9GAMM|nr:VCBS repeat-containing protein [Microbulbifer taiwanensis]